MNSWPGFAPCCGGFGDPELRGRWRGSWSSGDFRLDLNAHLLTRNGTTVALTSGEFDLLGILVRHPNQVLDRTAFSIF